MAFNVKLDIKWLIIPILLIISLSVFNTYQYNNNEELETYNRQLNGDLNSTERELQNSNYELGLSKSKLVTQKELNEILKNENEEKNEKFDNLVKKHKLEVKSRDISLARLKQQIKNGITITTIDPSCNMDDLQGCIISYQWKDPHDRFKLKDPNIFQKNNETFESSQLFRIRGEVWQQKNGSLQTRRISLVEVYRSETGEYKDIDGAKAEIIDSDFKYSNAPFVEEWKWQNLFRLRAVAISGVEILPNSGNLKFGLGVEFFTLYGFGIGSYTSLDFQHPELISQNISLQYNPTIMNTELNLGLFISIGTPFANFFNDYQFNSGMVFYLNN